MHRYRFWSAGRRTAQQQGTGGDGAARGARGSGPQYGKGAGLGDAAWGRATLSLPRADGAVLALEYARGLAVTLHVGVLMCALC